MKVAVHSTQNFDGEFEKSQYGQIYFSDNNNAVSERRNNPISNGISEGSISLLEYILRSRNPFIHGFMMMREVEEEVNRCTAAVCHKVQSMLEFFDI